MFPTAECYAAACGERLKAVALDELFDLGEPVVGGQEIVEGEDVVVGDRVADVGLGQFARQTPRRERDARGDEKVERRWSAGLITTVLHSGQPKL